MNVLTEETQNGWKTRLGSNLRPRQMSEYHQRWLEGLSEVAKRGMP
jgi:hypothetical protein